MNAPIIQPRRPFRSFIVPPCLVAWVHPNHCEQLCVPEMPPPLRPQGTGNREQEAVANLSIASRILSTACDLRHLRYVRYTYDLRQRMPSGAHTTHAES